MESKSAERLWLPQVVICAMMLWALIPGNPYGYYILVRWVCGASFAYLAWRAAETKVEGWPWVLGVSAAIYNPIIPLHLNRELWSLLNIAAIAIAGASIVLLNPKSIESNDAKTSVSKSSQ